MRRLLVGTAALVAVLLVFPTGPAAMAATAATYSDEVGGTGPTPRANASLLNSAWTASVTANGGTVQPLAKLPSGTITSLPIATDGTTTAVTRTRYSAGSSPVYVAPSSNQGTGTCFNNGSGASNAGAGLQGNAPRPTALVGGNGFCPNGFAYAEAGGAGENTTRDAVEFTFSRPILGFGAWFGDLETRTDGRGVAAIVRLFGAGNVLLSSQVVVPGPSYLPQSSCDNDSLGCGNGTTRWLGFVADPAAPVVRMVVIVGDEDARGTALDEGISFIGPMFDLSTASISLTKSATPLADTNLDGMVGAGDSLYYNFLVTNTGTLPVTSVAITDAAATGLSCMPSSLLPGASTTCTGSHIVTQAETNIGSVANTATATATVYGGSISSKPSSHTTTIPRVSGLEITKVVNASTYHSVGDLLTYDITVTNNSNVTVTNVTLSDPAPGLGVFSSVGCDAITPTMEPHDVFTCTASYTVTQEDLDVGNVVNTASTTGKVPSGATIGPFSDSATSTAIQSVSLDLTKSVAEPTFDAVGKILNYTITLSNDGNVTLYQPAVSDPAPGTGAFSSTCSVLPSELAPGATKTCTAAYTVTQADLDAGTVTNRVDASADDPGGVKIDAPRDTATSTAVVSGNLVITKSVTEPTFNHVGDVLHYTVTVTNNATVNVSSLVVTDVLDTGSGAANTPCALADTVLAPTKSTKCLVNYTVTQADLDAGSVTNSASASGVIAGGNNIYSPTAEAESTAVAVQALALSKTPKVASYSVVGSVIVYDLVLKNVGNVTLTLPEITDNGPGVGVFINHCDTLIGPISPGDSLSCSVSYTVTQADIDIGSLKNTANAHATAPNADIIAAAPAIAVTPAMQTVSLTLAKSVTEPAFDAVGDKLHYSLTLTNGGNTTLTAAAITDAAPGLGDFTDNCAGVNAALPPSTTVSCVDTYTVAQTDLDAGDVTNNAQGSADDPSLNRRNSNDATATSLARQAASFELVKTATETSYHDAGDVVHFIVTLTNTGNVSFTSTTVSDSSPGDGAFTTDCRTVGVTLAPGASRTCHGSYLIDVTDLTESELTNEVGASAVAAGGAVIGSVAQVSVPRGASTLAMTGTSAATLALIAFALLFIGGGVVWSFRARLFCAPPS